MRIFRNTKTLNLYKSLDTLKILTFWKIIQDKNILLLDFDYYDGKEYSNKDNQEIEQLWTRLYDEYYVLHNDPKSKHKIDKTFKELRLRELIELIKYNYDFLISLKKGYGIVEDEDIMRYEQECYARLKGLDKRIKINNFDGIESNLKYLSKFINSLINTYNREVKDNEKAVNNEVKNVYDVVASVESWLERSLPIEDITVTRWLAYEQQVKNKQKAHKNGK